ncbi:MAG: UDP-N-acetylglucosamine pyrophosphorylase [Clostridium sp.]
MELNLTTYKLGTLLKNITENYKTTLMTKTKVSGGFITMFGDASIGKIPENILSFSKGNNIIDIKIKTSSNESATLKVTGMQGGFDIKITETRYKEICKGKFSDEIKINKNESKLKIGEDIIFTIKAPVDELKKFL